MNPGKMEANWGNPGEIASAHVNGDNEVSNHGKKRKFLSEKNTQLSFPASKYICCETLVEHDPHDPFSKESLQAKVFYTFVRKEKTSVEEVDEDLGADSAQDSNMTAEDSFSGCSSIKPDGYANANSCGGPSSSYSYSGVVIPRSADSYFGSTTTGSIATSVDRENGEFDGNENCDDLLDEFGHCLGYLVSGLTGCDSDSKQQMDEELDEFLCMNAILPKSHPLLSEELIDVQASQLNERRPTIDQEFEDYFSTLML